MRERGYQLRVYVVGDGDPSIVERVHRAQDSGLPIELEFGAAQSLSSLEHQAEKVFLDLKRSGWKQVLATADVATGNIDVTLGTDPENPASSNSVTIKPEDLPRSALAHNVKVSTVVGPVSTEDHTYGGALTATTSTGTSGCTTGFVVRRPSDGLRGVVTAAHCGNDRWYNMGGDNTYKMSYVCCEHKGGYGDVQWHTTSHNEYDDFYMSSTNRRDVTGVRAANNQLPGDFACRYGRASGGACNTVYRSNVSYTLSSGTTLSRMTVMVNATSASGDSGGPWYELGEAWGIHSGRPTIDGSPRDSFSKADHLDSALGVVVATS